MRSPARLHLLRATGQRQQDLEQLQLPPEHAQPREALGVNRAATGDHVVYTARPELAACPQRVAVGGAPRKQLGDRCQSDVRVRSHIEVRRQRRRLRTMAFFFPTGS